MGDKLCLGIYRDMLNSPAMYFCEATKLGHENLICLRNNGNTQGLLSAPCAIAGRPSIQNMTEIIQDS